MPAWPALCAVLAGLALVPAFAARAPVGSPVVGADPADGAVLATAPDRVRLTGPAAPDPSLSHVTVRDQRGRAVAAGVPTAAGHVLSQPVRLTGAGDFTVAFHITFTDGEQAAGEVRFSVGTGAAPAPVRAEAAAAHEHGPDPLSAILLLIDAAVVAGAALLLALRPGPRARAAEAERRRAPPADG